MTSLIVVVSYHHNNTLKIAEAMVKVLDTQVKPPQQVSPKELQQHDLVGFGSGIDSERHYQALLDFTDRLPQATNKKAFIFSTSAMAEVEKNHSTLREKLQSKGYRIVGEFNCPGLNTNGFLKYFGGMNKGRPSAEDLKRAEEFTQKLKHDIPKSTS